MSFKIRSSQFVAGLFTVVVAIISASAAQAQILLTINDSDITHTVISYTGVAPLSSATPISESVGNGIDLIGLFTTTVNYDRFLPIDNTLSTGDASEGPIFAQAYGDILPSQTSNLDLNLFGTTTTPITFTANEAAFSGSVTFDMTGRNLQSLGTTGAIVTGYGGIPNTQIGEWKIVDNTSQAPEPSTWALLLGSVAVLPLLLRRRRV